MLSNTIPTIAVGAENKTRRIDKDTCYYFCSFEEALEKLRGKHESENEKEPARTTKKYPIAIPPPPPPPPPMEVKKEPRPRVISTRKGFIPGTRTINIIGKTYNWLTVIAFAGTTNGRTARWLCRCVCGTEKVIDGNNLKSGSTKSCGCMQKQMASELGKSNKGNLARKKKDGNL